MKTWAYFLNVIAIAGGLVLGGGLCFLSFIVSQGGVPEPGFMIGLGVCGVIHILLPWVGIVFLRRHTTTGYRVSFGISALSLLFSAGLIAISNALLFGVANP